MTQRSEVSQSSQAEAQARSEEEVAPEGDRQAYAKTAMEQTGKVLRTLSHKVRSVADSLREEHGLAQGVGKTVEKVAQKLETSADYLTGTTSREARSDVRGLIQRYPLRSLGVIFGVGLLLGTALRRRGA